MMKHLCFFLAAVFATPGIQGYSQTKSQTDTLLSIAGRYAKRYSIQKSLADEWAKSNGFPIRTEVDGSLLEIQYLDKNGRPQYFKTDNSVAAATISSNKVYPGGGAGLSLTGSGITVREWDGGSVLSTHQEFDTRVTNVDAVATHYHATHVAGTIMASGFVASAKGMAYQASLRSFDWNSDISEMASEGAAGALVSNHSYGYIRGWNSGTWYGDPAISTQEDYLFGFYDGDTQQWDQIAYNAPFYLICKSSGNDRDDTGTGYPADGPYDCIGQQGVAKNILTVGAVNDIPAGYSTPSGVVMSGFSSWGPADDGRIKPDIVANGISLYSTYNTDNTSYANLSGTSMSTPSVVGSLALLQQHCFALSGNYLHAATLKALVIHTADEAGPNTGPDYMFGWGLMNTKNAALKISADQTTDIISELSLNNGATFTREVVALGTEPLKVTIVWTDPPGAPPIASLDPITPMLVNDLDLRITQGSSTWYPWKLDRDNPVNAATNATENNVDNVEVVYIASPVAGATYTITVDHDGTLSGSSQPYAMIISGIVSVPAAPVADFYAPTLAPAINTQVGFSDVSMNIPTSWAWSFSPNTVVYVGGTTSASQNPQVQFTTPGQYTVTLVASNSYGSDTEIKTNYLNVVPFSYCIPTYSYGTIYDDYITLVQLGTINNATGASASPFYTYYSTLSTDLTPGTANTITLSPGTYESGNNISVWIDYNQNGVFETAEKLGNVNIPPTPATGTINFTVPSNATSGTTRMRVREVYGNSDFDACSTYGYGETEDYNVNINKALNLTLFIEGLFNGTTMNKAQNATGDQFAGTIADQITLELHNSTAPYALAGGPYTVNVNTNGSATVTVPASLESSYYLVVKHRNSIETWNASPLSFSGATMSYNFSTSAGQALGNNLKLISGKYLLYAGDVNQDGVVDAGDLIALDNDAANFINGYVTNDVNGDGLVNLDDLLITNANATMFIAKIQP